MKMKRIVSIMMIISLVSVGFTGCGKKDKAAMSQKLAVPVVAEKVKQGTITKSTVVNGTIAPSEEVVLMPKIAAQAVSVPFAVGERVQKGEVVLKLDSTTFALQVKQAEANLAVSQVQTNAQAALDHAKADLDRFKTLYESGAVSKQQLEQQELAYANAKSQFQVNQAQINQGQAAVDMARDNLNNATLASPISGVVTQRNIDPGEMASPGAAVFTIANVDQVMVKANLTESEIGKVKLGQKVKVAVNSGVNQTFDGEISSINPVANAQTKVYPIEIKIANPNHILKPGMFAKVTIDLETQKDVLVLSKTALVNKGEDGAKIVYVIEAPKKAKNDDQKKDAGQVVKERRVKVGLEEKERVEILSGVKAGEQVVVSGQLSLSDGTEVVLKSRGE